jgi:hypothetical protein
MKIETAHQLGLIDAAFYENRPYFSVDLGFKYALSGHTGKMVNGEWKTSASIRMSTREFYRRTGVDESERAGKALWNERQGAGLSRNKWEHAERQSTYVNPERPVVKEWMADTAYLSERDRKRAENAARRQRKTRAVFFELLETLNAEFAALGAESGKRPVIIVGRDCNGGRHVRGARGYCADSIITFLSEFFLVLLIDEYNTSKLCPRCHSEAVFANKRELRSKQGLHCKVRVPVVEIKSGIPVAVSMNELPFCYDRDLAASINFVYIAVFMAKTEGARPESFSPRRKTGPKQVPHN